MDGSGPGLLTAVSDPRCGAQVRQSLPSVKAAGFCEDDAGVFAIF